MAGYDAERRGTTLQDPAAVDWKPDLQRSLYDISEYLREQNAYDLFEGLTKELVSQQPKDPIDHMLTYLKATSHAGGPLNVIVSRAPGSAISPSAKKLATHFGLQYISAGELLRKSGVKTSDIVYADDNKVSELVVARLEEARRKHQGFVLEGFPRTRFQTSYLKEKSIVPTHVLVLTSHDEHILERNRKIAGGEITGEGLPDSVLKSKIDAHTCHNSSALEVYSHLIQVIQNTGEQQDAMFGSMVEAVRMVPRSQCPALPPRIVVLGPRGVGAKEHSKRLASRLGAVFVDGAELLKRATPVVATKSGKGKKAEEEQLSAAAGGGRGTLAIMDLPNVEALTAKDPLGIVGVRLRQEDCRRQGWVLSGFPNTVELAGLLASDEKLAPVRTVVLKASEEICMSRLRHIFVDSVTGEIWTTLPVNAELRKRMQRRPEDNPAKVSVAHSEHQANIQGVIKALGVGGRCLEIDAEGSPEKVFAQAVEFVERPLPIPDGVAPSS